MKKLLIVLILLCAGQAWGANEIYYVSSSGSNTAPYDTWSKAATALETIIATVNNDGDNADADTIYVAPGTYAESFSILGIGASGATFLGTSAHGSIAPAALDQVIMSKATAYAWRNDGANNVTVRYITITGGASGSAAFLLNGPTGFTFSHGAIRDSSGICLRIIGGSTGFNVHHNLLGGCAASAIRIEGSAAGQIAHNLIAPTSAGLATTSGNGIWNTSSGELNIYHNAVLGIQGGNGVYGNGAGTTNIANNYFGAPVSRVTANINRAAGTINLLNNLIMGNWDKTTAPVTGTINTDTDNLITSIPKYTAPKRGGFISFGIDDSDAIGTDWLLAIEASLAARGMKGTHYVNGAQAAANAAALSAMHGRGVIEIANHGWSHSKLGTTGTIYAVTKAGATITIDRDENLITVTPGGTISNFKSMSVTGETSIKTSLEALGCTVGDLTADLRTNLRGEAFTGVADQSIDAGYNIVLLIDATGSTGFFQAEMALSKTALEAAVGATIPSYGTASNSASADAATAAKTLGHESMRYGTYANADVGWMMSSLNIYKMASIDADYFDNADPDLIRLYAKKVGQFVAEAGAILYFYCHVNTDGGNPDISNVNIDILLDAWKEIPGLVVTSQGDAVTQIKAAGATADEITYTRTWTSAANYRPLPGADLRNAGTAVFTRAQYIANGGDASGRTEIYVLPDIGAYETFEELSFLPTKPFLDDPWICPPTNAACYVQP